MPTGRGAWLGERGSGFTVSSTDWDDDFANQTLVQFDLSTESGHLQLLGNTTSYPVRYTIAWDSPRRTTIPAIIHTLGNNIQIKMNGTVSDYNTTTGITLDVQEGRNVLRIAHDGAVGLATFEARLFDGKDFHWVDLRGATQ